MKNIDINGFSQRWRVRRLEERDAPLVLELMDENPQYYEYCGKSCSIDEIIRDMSALPPGKSMEEKYYLGFFELGHLIAVMDFIDGYPDEDTAYIGFFMLTDCYQGKKIATALVERICLYCTQLGYKRVMLGYEKSNPQSSHFWLSNGFEPQRELEQEGGIIVAAERALPPSPAEPLFENFLLRQSAWKKGFEPRDALKMCYQAAFGAEHGLQDPSAARKYLRMELTRVKESRIEPLYEQISPSLCRVNLRTWKAHGLKWQWLYAMFSKAEGTGDIEPYLSTVAAHAKEGRLPFDSEAWEGELASWDGGPVSHSQRYRETYDPAYRIAPIEYMYTLPVLEKMAQYPDGCVVAIDGRSNSGKSSLADRLCAITGAGLVRMDDFLWPGGRTVVEELGMVGGNVHYDMIKDEVLPYLKSPKAFSHRYFEGHTIRMDRKRRVCASPYRIVEGSFSQHAYFGKYWDIKVFMTTDSATQRRRVMERDGEALAASYYSLWIPMEDEYIDFFRLEERAEVVIRT